ncbi:MULTISPECIES: hypothetical protein [unclassified Shewanella]|uniref:hypothetical protein n=1 Tax=unclassified Shewanella TaxID=196818 RepID=UPI0035507484
MAKKRLGGLSYLQLEGGCCGLSASAGAFNVELTLIKNQVKQKPPKSKVALIISQVN